MKILLAFVLIVGPLTVLGIFFHALCNIPIVTANDRFCACGCALLVFGLGLFVGACVRDQFFD